jgi:hypothetical protein
MLNDRCFVTACYRDSFTFLCVVFIECNVSFIVCAASCAVFRLGVVFYFVWYKYFCVLYLIVVPIPRGRSSSPGRVKTFLHTIQTGSGDHPTSTWGSFFGDKAAGKWRWPLTSNQHPGQENVDLYIRSPIRLHGAVLSQSSTGTSGYADLCLVIHSHSHYLN